MRITTISSALIQNTHYKNNSCLRNIYKGYSPKIQVKIAGKGNNHA